MSGSSRYVTRRALRRLGGRLALVLLLALGWGLWAFGSRPWADTAPPAPATWAGPAPALTPDPGWACPPETYMLDGVCEQAPTLGFPR